MFLRVLAVAFLFCSGLAWADPVPAGAAEVVVRIGARLDPAEVTVAPGTVVRWVNEDGDRHRVRSTGGPAEFDSGNLETGDSFTATFSAAGRTTYVDDRDRGNAANHGAVTVTDSGGAGGGGTAPGPPSDPGGGAAAPPPPSSATITMANRAFSPTSVVLAPGGTITWTNRDDRDHTGTAQGGAFDTGNLGAGATATTTHPTEGTFSFFCELHPEMTGVVRVSSASGAAPAPAPAPAPPPAAAPPPSPPTDPPPPATPTPAGAATSGPSTRNVQIGDLFFSPPTLDLRVGDTVVWTNGGRAPHTATSSSFDSGRLATGGTFRWTAPSAGTITYGCTLHPEMTGRLRIVAASAAPPPVVSATATGAAPAIPTASAAGATAEAAPAPPATDTAPSAPATADVKVQDFAFAPAAVRIAAGGTVTWSFTGAAPHTATGAGFDSGIVETGATFEHTFAEAGTFAYSCTVHPDMTGTVEVIETDLIAANSPSPPAGSPSSPRGSASSDGTQAWTVALLGGAGILGGTGALLLGARRFLLAS